MIYKAINWFRDQCIRAYCWHQVFLYKQSLEVAKEFSKTKGPK